MLLSHSLPFDSISTFMNFPLASTITRTIENKSLELKNKEPLLLGDIIRKY